MSAADLSAALLFNPEKTLLRKNRLNVRRFSVVIYYNVSMTELL